MIGLILLLVVVVDTMIAATIRHDHGSESRVYLTYELHSCWTNVALFGGVSLLGLVHGWGLVACIVYALTQVGGATYASSKLDPDSEKH